MRQNWKENSEKDFPNLITFNFASIKPCFGKNLDKLLLQGKIYLEMTLNNWNRRLSYGPEEKLKGGVAAHLRSLRTNDPLNKGHPRSI